MTILTLGVNILVMNKHSNEIVFFFPLQKLIASDEIANPLHRSSMSQRTDAFEYLFFDFSKQSCEISCSFSHEELEGSCV